MYLTQNYVSNAVMFLKEKSGFQKNCFFTKNTPMLCNAYILYITDNTKISLKITACTIGRIGQYQILTNTRYRYLTDIFFFQNSQYRYFKF